VTKNQALRILIADSQKRMQELAVDANLYKRGHTGPHFENAHKKYQERAAAIQWAEAEMGQQTLWVQESET
jgi:hypothetical protein